MEKRPLIPSSAYLDPELSPALVLSLEVRLREIGKQIVDQRSDDTLTFSTGAALASAAGGPSVGFLEPTFSQEALAAAFAQAPTPLLVACRGPDGGLAPWEASMLFALLANDGIVPTGIRSKTFELKQKQDIDEAVEATHAFVCAAAGGMYAAGAAADVMHEICANALLDAPANEDGTPRYAHRRGEDFEIPPEDAARARVVVDQENVYLQAADRFGRLRAPPVAAALRQLGGTAELNTNGGGAGLGLLRMINQSDLLCFRVAPGRRSEVTCVLTLENVRRRSTRPKSVWYLEASGA